MIHFVLPPRGRGDLDEEKFMLAKSRANGKMKESDSLQRCLEAKKVGLVKQQDSLGRMAQVSFVSPLSEEEDTDDVSFLKQKAISRPARHASSKYDFVKVRVWLGDNSDHYYVLSRFLVSRMLTVTKIPNHVAIKIALELKKLLIDNSLLDVSQADLEANLFKLMERRTFGTEYRNRYKMMTRFHHQRIPLVILVCGAACVGKSTIATQLAQRLNLPNVLQTDMVYELLRTASDPPLATTPVWAREFSTPEELINEFCRECRIVRKGLGGDISKAMTDGKPVIIEGIHLDPSIYMMDEKNGSSAGSEADAKQASIKPTMPTRSRSIEELDTVKAKHPKSPESLELGTSHALKALVESGDRVRPLEKVEAVNVEQDTLAPVDPRANGGSALHSRLQATDIKNVREEASGSSKDMDGAEVGQGESQEDEKKPPLKPPTKAIVVPIILKMAEIDYQTLLEEWIACRSVDGSESHEDMEALVSKFRIIQDYLCSFESQGMKVVNISATTFPQTLDWLHSYLLQCIERGCAAPDNSAGS